MYSCICCSESKGQLLKLNKCIYSTYLYNILSKYSITLSTTLICIPCHAILKKAYLFQSQVENNCRKLTQCLDQYSQQFQHRSPFTLQIVNIESIDYAESTIKGKSNNLENIYESDSDKEIAIIKEEQQETSEIDDGIEFDATELKSEEVYFFEKKGRKKRKKVKEHSKTDINLSFVEKNIRRIDLSKLEVLTERNNDELNNSYVAMKYKCTYCKIGFDFEEIFKDHMEKKHNKENGDFICEICCTVFNKKSSYNIHYKRHYIRFECAICGHRGIDKASMERHIQEHNLSVQFEFTCEICGFIAKSKRSFRYHKEKHNSQHKCGFCLKTYVNNNALKHHILFVHKKERNFSCEDCGKTYKGKSGLLMHKLTHEKAPAEAYCQHCDHQFKTIYIYQQHLKTSSKHTTEDDKKFICECGLKFLRKQRLQEHIDWVHLKRNQHVCDICDKKFMRLRGLMKHKKFVHEKLRAPRDKICDHCGKGFTSNAILAQHIRTHTGERPIKCSLCDATFAQSAALYTHSKLIHKQKQCINDVKTQFLST